MTLPDNVYAALRKFLPVLDGGKFSSDDEMK